MTLYDRETGKMTRAQRYSHKKSFGDIGKNLNIIARRMMQDEELIKLLVHTTQDALELPLTNEQIESVFGDQIKIIPAIDKEEDMKNYVVIQFGAFTPADKENEYKNYIITFDIICNMDKQNWILNDYTPRVFKIMGKIDDLINKTKIDSVGPVMFVGATQLIISEELSGFSLNYQVMSEQ